ncbi:MAG: hypothetical protein KDA30_04905 [Phycisphaerales bacterium]|nr:hypothetical protein [Phycisphaerales bacterium]
MSVMRESMARVGGFEARRVVGSVTGLRGLTVRACDLPAPLGALVRIGSDLDAEVIGFEARQAILLPLSSPTGVRAGDRVTLIDPTPCIGVGDRLKGRVIDGLGRAIDGGGAVRGLSWRPIRPEPISAMSRKPIDTMMRTGVRAIDLMTTMGLGQRMGVFAGPGVGKSTLLGMIARRSAADVNVIAMIGERGREVREFIEDALGEQGLSRSVLVVSTSDESPVMRVRAAMAACTIAEHFRDQGLNVMFMLDSVTRFAHAQRGHFPAVDVLDSVSRVSTRVAPEDLLGPRTAAMRLLASYQDVEELLQIGAYARGSNPETDAAIDAKPRLDSVLRQTVGEGEPFEVSKARLATITEEAMASMRNGGRDTSAGRTARAPATPKQGGRK